MKRVVVSFLFVFILLLGGILICSQLSGAEKKGDYLLPGNVKEGWKIFAAKKCNLCHAIWGEGGKGGPDLGTPPGILCQPIPTGCSDVESRTRNVGKDVSKKNPFRKNGKEGDGRPLCLSLLHSIYG